MIGTSVYVQSPTTQIGRPRARLGLWRYRLNRKTEPWGLSASVDAVVEYIKVCSKRLR